MTEKEIIESEKPNSLIKNNWDENLNRQLEFYNRCEKIILTKIRNIFNTNFRNKDFVSTLSECVDLNYKLAKISGLGFLYQQFSNANYLLNDPYLQRFRDRMYITPSHKIHSEDNYSLFHYYTPHQNQAIQKSKEQNTGKSGTLSEKRDAGNYDTDNSKPLLIIYAFINRNYMLDLLPDSSIVKNFQNQGFGIYILQIGVHLASK